MVLEATSKKNERWERPKEEEKFLWNNSREGTPPHSSHERLLIALNLVLEFLDSDARYICWFVMLLVSEFLKIRVNYYISSL